MSGDPALDRGNSVDLLCPLPRGPDVIAGGVGSAELPASLSIVSAQVERWQGGVRRGRHSVMAELSKRHEIWWVTYPHGLTDLFRNSAAPSKHWFTWSQTSHGRVHELSPPLLLPASRFRAVHAVTRRLRETSLRRLLRRNGRPRPVLYVWYPIMSDLVGHLDEQLVVYHKFDHFAHNLGVGPDLLAREAELIRRADLFIVVSEALRQLHAHQRPDIHVIPNGVNWQEFEAPAALPGPLREALERIPRPRLCYTGPISDKVDLGALRHLAVNRPEWSLVLVGPEGSLSEAGQTALNLLRALPNVHQLPAQPGQLIPGILARMDVCLLANCLTEYTHHTSPLKLYDYLASGKPVVASDLEAVRPFVPAVAIARTPDEWEAQVAAALDGDGSAAAEERRRIAQGHSWSVRVSEIEALMAAALGRRGQGPTAR